MGELRGHRAPRPVRATREALRWAPWRLAEVAGGGQDGFGGPVVRSDAPTTSTRSDRNPYAFQQG